MSFTVTTQRVSSNTKLVISGYLPPESRIAARLAIMGTKYR